MIGKGCGSGLRKLWIVVLLLLPAYVAAQEGHPLVGTWHGSWGTNAKDRTDLTLVMNYDGKTIIGMINPGPDSMTLRATSLDPATWTVHFEADGKDASGKKVSVVAEGKIENITNARRSLTGSWSQGQMKGEFKLIRDN